MAKKKVTRKQLLKEPDEFLTFSTKLFNLTVAYRRQIAIAGATIVALILVFSALRFFSNRSESKAFAMLGQANRKYVMANTADGVEKAYESVKEDFQRLLDKYGRKQAGKIARVAFADICYNAGDYDQAISLYQTAMPDFEKNPFYKHRLVASLGYAHAGKKEYPQAARFFEMILNDPEAAGKDEALFNLVGIYSAMGEAEKSREAIDRIVSDYGDSMYIPLAREKKAG